MNKILHITPHLGGGIGTVLLSWLKDDRENNHSIATLDNVNECAIKKCKDINIPLFSQLEPAKIVEKMENFDIIVIHFWNHPLLYKFLVESHFPASRIIFWAHISGAEPPYVFNKKLFNMCEKFIFTTPISQNFVNTNDKFETIMSMGDIEKIKNIQKEPHKDFIAGYIGTVDYAKMHGEYVKTLSKTNADKIIIVGGDSEKEISKNCDDRFIFTGKLQDVTPVLKQLDVFAYLLSPKHYGTAEQVIQEAMACGIVPVVLSNACEKTLVKHNQTGLVANDLDEYVNYINLLKTDIGLRNKLSQNAKRYANENFSLRNLTKKWNNVFDDVMKLERTPKKWALDNLRSTSYDIFLESLGDYSSIFKNKADYELKEILKHSNWKSDTKGTPKQYFKFLQGKELEHICSLYE